MTYNRQTKTLAVAAVLVLVLLFTSIYFVRRGSSNSAAVSLPQNFLLSRKTAALVSQSIVDITNKTDDKIAAANAADLAGDKVRAEALIEDAQTANKEAYHAAAQLADQLKILTESLSSINSLDSQRLAYEAVATEFSLVSEFIIYTQNLNDFLEKITVSMETDVKVSKNDIAGALKKTNDSAKKINTLNAEFNDRMTKLDKSF